MRIYTKKGDRGKTSLCGKKGDKQGLVSKDSLKIKAIGVVDELNSFVGITISFSNISKISLYLKEIQKNLMVISSTFAGKKLGFNASETKKIEKLIDKYEKLLPKLSNFVLPGGTVFASHLQYARSLARKTERSVVALSKREKVNPNILAYLNRLSDLLFTLARYVNNEAKVGEGVWLGNKEK